MMKKQLKFQSFVYSKSNGKDLKFSSNIVTVEVEVKQKEPKITYYSKKDCLCKQNCCNYDNYCKLFYLIWFLRL